MSNTATMTMTEPAASSPQLKIEALYTYPIKSIRGLALPSIPADPLGFALDRRFMLIDPTIDPKSNHVTNMHVSHYTEMCLFTTHIPSSHGSTDISNMTSFEVHYAKPHSFKDPSVLVSADHLTIPVEPDVTDLSTMPIKMHNSPTIGHDMGPKYNDWFSARFGYEVKLLYLGANRRAVLGNMAPSIAAKQARGELPKYAGLAHHPASPTASPSVTPSANTASSWLGSITSTISSLASPILGSANSADDEDGIDTGIGFADVAPFLLVSQTSNLAAAKLLSSPSSSESSPGADLDVTKFRPNIIVSGSPTPFDEDFWGEVAFFAPSFSSSSSSAVDSQEVRLVLTQNCARCTSLNVSYSTGKPAEGAEGKLLALLSKDRRVDQGAKWSPVFGRYGFLAGKGVRERKGKGEEVRLSVGMGMEVRRRLGGRGEFEWPGLSTNQKKR